MLHIDTWESKILKKLLLPAHFRVIFFFSFLLSVHKMINHLIWTCIAHCYTYDSPFILLHSFFMLASLLFPAHHFTYIWKWAIWDEIMNSTEMNQMGKHLNSIIICVCVHLFFFCVCECFRSRYMFGSVRNGQSHEQDHSYAAKREFEWNNNNKWAHYISHIMKNTNTQRIFLYFCFVFFAYGPICSGTFSTHSTQRIVLRAELENDHDDDGDGGGDEECAPCKWAVY